MLHTLWLCVSLFIFATIQTTGQTLDPRLYDIGSPVTMDVWVDPQHGDDGRSGDSRANSLHTLTAAWTRIPQGTTLSGHGYRIILTAGTYPADQVPAYWESRYGTREFPVILESADGTGTAVLPALNIFDCRYFYLIGIAVLSDGGDVVHIERGDHMLLRDSRLTGVGDIQLYDGPDETLKVNQSQSIFIERNDISGAINNAVDFVAVQYGDVVDNRIHRSSDWCMYMKGGSAYFRIEGNEIFDCGTGGFTAGQGTGFEFMVAPWLHYEAYDLKFINNVVHDTEGAGIGVNGGYNILLAFNTLYRVGRRSHGVEVVYGMRECDGNEAQCEASRKAGGWGPGTIDEQIDIPNRNIYIFNNILYNPPGFESPDQHFAIFAAEPGIQDANLPASIEADRNLRIEGNIIWNGPASLPLGIEGGQGGCQDDHPTCNELQLRVANRINQMEPQLKDPPMGDFRPVAGGNVLSIPAVAIPAFPDEQRSMLPEAPAGVLQNLITRDRNNMLRSQGAPAGAYARGAPIDVVWNLDSYVRRVMF